MPYLVLFDCDKIQKYVYASSRQAEIRMASRLLEKTTEEIRDWANKTEGATPIGVAAASGGVWLEGSHTKDDAEELEKKIIQEFREIGIECTTCIHEVSGTDAFNKAWETAESELRKKKDSPEKCGTLIGSPLFIPCESTGLQSAECVRKVGGGKRRLSKVAAEQRKASEQKQGAVLDWETNVANGMGKTDVENLWDKYLCSEMKQIRKAASGKNGDVGAAPDAEQFQVALIAADVNDAGNTFRKFNREQRIAASETLQVALGEAVGSAIAESLGASKERYPAFPIYVGGDDLMVYVPAASALKFAQKLCEEFLGNQEGTILNPPLTIAVGVAFGKEKTPFRQLATMAQAAEGRAKHARRSLMQLKHEGAGDVCYVEYEPMQGTLPIAARTANKAYPVSAGPFIVGAPDVQEEAAPWALKTLLGVLKELRENDFPSNKVKAWAELAAIHTDDAPISYLASVKNLRKEPCEKLEKAISKLTGCSSPDILQLPVRTRGNRKECPLVDLPTLWDIVGKDEG